MANANNQANFDEVEAHCRLASAKLAQLLQKEPAATGALEDLEDYYDRQMQLRVMQNNTLLEQLKEARAAQAALREMLSSCALGAVAVVVAYFVAANPWGAYSVVSEYWSYCAVACIAYLASRATL